MHRLRELLLTMWKNRWAFLLTAITLILLFREWSPPSYRVITSNVEVRYKERRIGEPIIAHLSRCNDTSRTAVFHYIRRLHSTNGDVWPLAEGNAPIDPGCLTIWVEVGVVPQYLPAGTWRVRTDNSSINWLWKQTFTTWVSDSFEVLP